MKNSKVYLMSLQSEKSLSWWNLSLAENERNALLNAFENKRLSYNSIGAEFEHELARQLGCRYALVTTSGSVALLLALQAVGVEPGDEVIIPNRTFQATANAVHFLGARAVLVDVNTDDGLINIDEVKRNATNKTKAIIAVHLNGRGVDVAQLRTWADENKVFVIEDTAQAMMSKNDQKFLGTQGDVGCLSFGVTKFITSGQGGAILTDSELFYRRAKNFIFHAVTGHDDKHFDEFGFNFRQSDLLSAMALAQLQKCEIKIEKFQRVFIRYAKGLRYSLNVKLLGHHEDKGELPIWIEALCARRDELFFYLKENGIESMKFYPSINRSPYLNQVERSFPNSEKFEKNGIILPCGPDILPEQIDRVILAIKEFDRIYGT